MDPFTTAIRALIGKKMVDSAKSAYKEATNSIDKMVSNWDAAIRSKGQTKTANNNGQMVSDIFDANGTVNTDPALAKRRANTSEKTQVATDNSVVTDSSSNPEAKTVDDSEIIEYTYKPNDTFGQVLLDLGLGNERTLWGVGGDVDYYTQQLREQGALDRYGNIPIGTTIRLKRRK